MERAGKTFAEELRIRTKVFAFDVLKFCRTLPRTDEARINETLFWLEAVAETGILPSTRAGPLLKEGDELVRILTSSQRTARRVRATP